MKLYRVVWLVGFIATTLNLQAQKGASFSKSSYIEPFKLEVTYNKTSNLVFPDAITSIDRGSQDIIVQKAEGVDNILKIKAAAKTFEETNLSVITKDGKLYSFLVSYNPAPSYLNINISQTDVADTRTLSTVKEVVSTNPSQITPILLKTYLEKAKAAKPNTYSVWDRNSKMYVDLNGVYVKDNIMFCRLQLQNASAIDYGIDQVRFYIREKRASKRTASQEIELVPLQVLGDTSNIRGKGLNQLVFAVPKFTIPDGKYLVIEFLEKGGGRHLNLKVKNRHVMKAKPLSM